MRRAALVSGAVVVAAAVTLPLIRRQFSRLLVHTTGTVIRTQVRGG